ncbi:hypothetical protein RSO01_81760 [Reyranella soli]|uniref:Uncharacterized protein n=1 Tax=Reyranella soli TaxID=1230389 RepID=A0A512NPY7_9HYPH|nr:hypothetical protein RSO01_81760 [Reyranella soli]
MLARGKPVTGRYDDRPFGGRAPPGGAVFCYSREPFGRAFVDGRDPTDPESGLLAHAVNRLDERLPWNWASRQALADAA